MKTIVVLGMHHSGTSAVAGLLTRLGGHVGDSAALPPPADDNPRGFYEHQELEGVNDAVLQELGGTWQDPPIMPDGWTDLPSLDSYRARARRFLDELSTEGEIIVLKDPRLCLTLPFWEGLAPIDHVVATDRHPAQVAASLLVRNGFPPDLALRLWIRYVVDGLTHSVPDIRIHYPDLVADPMGIATRLAGLIGRQDLDAAAESAVQSFTDGSLGHHETTEVPSSSTLALAEWLHDLVRSDPQRARNLAAGIGAVWRDPRSTSARREAQTTWGDEIRALTEENEWLKEQHSANENEMAFLDARARRLQYEVEEATTTATHLRRRAERARRERDEAHGRRARLERRVDQREREAHAAEERATELAEHIADQREEMRRLEARVATAERAFDRLSNRRAVRAALGLAALARPLFRAVRRARRSDSPPPTASRTDPSEQTQVSTRSDPSAPGFLPPRELRPVDAPPVLALDWDRAEEWHQTPRPPTRSQPEVVTIIIPVHGSGDVVERCLEALWQHTSAPARLCLIDDASPDDQTRSLMRAAATRPGIDLLVNKKSLGFMASANRGLQHAAGDVVILSSDFEVGPRWLERLQHAAYASTMTGTVTAVSDDAGVFSVPTPGRTNAVPAHLDPATAARLVAQTSTSDLPSGPTANWFCCYVKAAVLEDAGVFDEDALPDGYGEEKDLSMQALRAGWQHVVEPGTFVRHLHGASFGEEHAQLMAGGRIVLDEPYPDHTALVHEWKRSEPMARLRNRVARVWREPDLSPAGNPAVLYVLQAGSGGSPAAALDLAAAMEGQYSCLVLTCDTRVLRLHRVVQGEPHLIEAHHLDSPIAFSEIHRDDVWAILESIMVRHAIELVHVRHLVKQTLDAPEVAASLGIPYVLSLHDFYLVCPTINLLDEEGRYCAGRCTDGPGPCPIAMRWIERDVGGTLKHDGVHQWRRTVRPTLDKADALVTTSQAARLVFANAFPDLDITKMQIIEHGRDLPPADVASEVPRPGGRVRILVPGNLDLHKGAQLIADMLHGPGGDRLDFHFLGVVPERYAALGVDHGPYERMQFADRVREIQPHLLGVLSTCGETYSHTLSEAWATDIPVVATDIGALGERVRAHGGALLVPHDRPLEATRRILELADDAAAYEALRRPDADAVRPTSAMAMDYDLLYRDVLDRRRSFSGLAPTIGKSTGRSLSNVVASPRQRVGLVAIGNQHRAPASVHIRTLRRLSHPIAVRHLAWRRVDVGEIVRGTADVDVVLVQRTAVPPHQIREMLNGIEEHGYGLVVEIDDYLWNMDHLPEGGTDWRPHVLGLRSLMQRANLVMVSTSHLAELARELTTQVAVVSNDLDERLWLRPLATPEPDFATDLEATRVLYVGTRTHADDLALLDPVFEQLDAAAPGSWQLTVVGGEPNRSVTPPTHERIDAPLSARNYPSFVPWVRQLAQGFDIAVAPLYDTEFAQAKSDLKWLEYTGMGLPTVLSNVGPYAASVKDGETGLLVPNSAVDWVDALLQLRDDHRLRSHLYQAARSHVTSHRLLRHSVQDWVQLILSVPSHRELEVSA